MSALPPVKLRSDNFTPPSRTPWGGTRIRAHYKHGLVLPPGPPEVGESWEVSVEPSFPSRAASGDAALADVIAEDPIGWLGGAVARQFDGQTPLLVKLLDSAANLSVQVHPEDGDPALAEGESGKPESWIVLEARPGAGFYLGFKDGVTRADVEDCLDSVGPLDDLLNFVPVRAGDAFIIAAGTPHAIGAGVTLVEPQFVAPGRRGLTYRFWDWNRLYDADGHLAPAERGGRPRELHRERSLAVTRWDAPRGAAFVESCRAKPESLCPGRQRLVDWPWFQVERWSGLGDIEVEGGSMWAIVCVAGEATFATTGGEIRLRRGESAIIPAATDIVRVDLEEAAVIATRSRPDAH